MPKKKVYCYCCGEELLVSDQAFSVCCPSCSQRVEVRDHTNSVLYPVDQTATLDSTPKKRVCCSNCGKESFASVQAFSICCPHCSGRIDVDNHDVSSGYSAKHSKASVTESKKGVYCLYCGREFFVSVRAFSVCCPSCSQRVSVEDHTITSHYNINYIETCGSLLVAPEGSLQARLRVRTLQVQGQHQGNVTVTEKVTLDADASFVGDITASRLEVNAGAQLEGFCRIEPQKSNGA